METLISDMENINIKQQTTFAAHARELGHGPKPPS